MLWLTPDGDTPDLRCAFNDNNGEPGLSTCYVQGRPKPFTHTMLRPLLPFNGSSESQQVYIAQMVTCSWAAWPQALVLQ